jgi:hypothetical protein
VTAPLFTDEGPPYYAAAYAHNRPFAKPPPYRTPLGPDRERQFRAWVAAKHVRFDPDEDPSDYDMRGFWLSGAAAGREPSGAVGYPDTYKTPYDTTFSRESEYATPNCPFVWQGNDLVDMRSGQLIFRRSTTHESGYGTRWHVEVRHPDGTTGNWPLRLVSGGTTESHWEGVHQLGAGDQVYVVSHGGTVHRN